MIKVPALAPDTTGMNPIFQCRYLSLWPVTSYTLINLVIYRLVNLLVLQKNIFVISDKHCLYYKLLVNVVRLSFSCH
jgi:hypothetical protein